MARVLVRYLDPGANLVRERAFDAVAAPEARAQVEAGGGLVLSVAEPATAGWLSNSSARTDVPAREVAMLCRELRALLGAGLSVVESLDALAVGARHADGPPIHAELLARLQAGKSLSTAMRDLGGFPALLVASVQSSERTSNLDDALAAYLRYDEMVGALRRKVVNAALYPAIVVSLGVAVSIFLVLVVIPRFAALYGEMASGAGTATRLLMTVSVALNENPWAVVALIVAPLAAGVWILQGGRWRRAVMALVRAVPWLRGQFEHFEMARTYEALALLVKGGYSLHESMELSRGVATSDDVDARLQRAREAIGRGVGVAPAFAAARLSDEVAERLLRAGDRGGGFDRVLQAIGDRHARAFETFVERTSRVVEPVLLLLVALLVGGMVVLLYMPIFDIASSVR